MRNAALAAGCLLSFLCASEGRVEAQSFGNDALPSAEVTAFRRTHARLKYGDARIDYDEAGCVVYQGRRRDGRLARARMRDGRGRLICPSRR